MIITFMATVKSPLIITFMTTTITVAHRSNATAMKMMTARRTVNISDK